MAVTFPPDVPGTLYVDPNGNFCRAYNYGTFFGYTLVDPVTGLPTGGETFTSPVATFQSIWSNPTSPIVPLTTGS